MINLLDRLPLVINAIRDFFVNFLAKRVIWLIIAAAIGVAILVLANSIDFTIICQPYDTNSGITCPLR